MQWDHLQRKCNFSEVPFLPRQPAGLLGTKLGRTGLVLPFFTGKACKRFESDLSACSVHALVDMLVRFKVCLLNYRRDLLTRNLKRYAFFFLCLGLLRTEYRK